MEKLKVGDIIEFTNEEAVGDSLSIPEKFYSEYDGIPSEHIIHGSTTLRRNEGKIVAIVKNKETSNRRGRKKLIDVFIVNFENRGNKNKYKFTQLGFDESNLRLKHIEEKTFKISYVQSGETKVEVINARNREDAFSKIKYESINYVMEN
jgi:hypothetical protein